MPDALITLNQTFVGQPLSNVVCFSNITEDNTQLQELADQLRLSYNSLVIQYLSDNWVLESIDVSFLGASEIEYTVNIPFTAGPLTGGSTIAAAPPNAPLLVSTIYVGPKPNRGRIYFTGIHEDEIDNGVYSTDVRNAFQAMVEAWRDGITLTGNTAFLRILRRPSAVFPSYVSSQVDLVSPKFGAKNQRRRSR